MLQIARTLVTGVIVGVLAVACGGGGGDAAPSPSPVPAPSPASPPVNTPVIAGFTLDSKGAYRDATISTRRVTATFSVVSVGASNISVANASILNASGQSAGQITVPVQAAAGSTVQVQVDLVLAQLPLGVYTINLTAQNASGATSNVLTTTYSYLANPWESIPPPPPDVSLRFPRLYAAVAEFGGKVYVLTGLAGGSIASRFVDVLDPATRTWTRGVNAPRDRGGATAVVANGKIFVIGGYDTSARTPVPEVDVFDPATGTWSQAANLPTPRYLSAAVAVGGKIYVMGGTQAVDAFFNRIFAQPMDTVEVLDVATGNWASGPKLPLALIGPAAAAHDGVVYVSGGLTATGAGAVLTSAVYRLAPAAGVWNADAGRHLQGRAHHALMPVGGKLYAIGGIAPLPTGGALAPTTTVESAPLASMPSGPLVWSTGAPLNEATWSFSGLTIGTKGYAFGSGSVFVLSPELDVL
jgi:hypothetical protein